MVGRSQLFCKDMTTTTTITLLSLPDEVLSGVVAYLPAIEHRNFLWSARRFATRRFVRRVVQDAPSFVLCMNDSPRAKVLAVSPDSKRCIVRGRFRLSSIWSLETAECLQTLRSNTTCAVFCLDGKRVIVGSTPSRLDVFGPESDLEVFGSESDRVVRWSIPMVMNGTGIRDVDVMPDGRRAVMTTGHNQIVIWDIDSGVSERTIDFYEEIYLDEFYVVPLPDCVHVACMDSYDLSVWNVDTGEMVRRFNGGDDADAYHISPRKFRPSADGKKLRTVSTGMREMREWCLDTGTWEGVWEEGNHFRAVDRTRTPDDRSRIEWYLKEWKVGVDGGVHTTADESMVLSGGGVLMSCTVVEVIKSKITTAKPTKQR